MMMMRIGLFLLLLLPVMAVGQVVQEPVNINYFKYATVGGGAHNLGWFVSGRYGLSKTKNSDIIYEFDIWRTKHPKEVRVQNQQFVNPKAYTFGKVNDLYNTHLGIGTQRVIFDKGEKRGVEVRYHVSGGASLAVLLPVYLEVLYATSPNDPFRFTTRTELYDPNRHFADNIYGGASFGTGFSELKIQPGIYGKGGFVFEWGSFTEEIRVLEAGLAIDFFPKPVPVMALIENNRLFMSFYLGIHLGKRW